MFCIIIMPGIMPMQPPSSSSPACVTKVQILHFRRTGSASHWASLRSLTLASASLESKHSVDSGCQLDMKWLITWLKEWQSRHDICLELDVVPRFFSLFDDLGQPITHNQRNAVCIRSQFEGLHQIYTKLDLRWMFPKIAVPPYHPFYKVFHYKPSILGVPYSWKHPDVLRFFQFGPCSPL